VEDRERGAANAADDHAGHAELGAQLLERGPDDRIRIEVRVDPLRDAVHHRLAVRAGIGLRDGERVVQRARDILPEEHDELELVARDRVRPRVHDGERADEPRPRHEWEGGERPRGGEHGDLRHQLGPVQDRGGVVDHEGLLLADQPGAHGRREGADRVDDARPRRDAGTVLGEDPDRLGGLLVLEERRHDGRR
jgi:hypothetical protein